MDLQRPFSVITPTVDGDVLAVLAAAEASFTGRQVHRVAGRHSERGIRNALQRLCAQGIVRRERVGPADQFTLNRSHLAAPHIVAIAALRTELLRRIAEEIDRWARPPAFGAIFGSAARGDMRPESDIDLLLVRQNDVTPGDPAWRDAVASLAQSITSWTGNDTRVLELDVAETAAGLQSGDEVLISAREEGVVVHGPLTYLSRLNRAGSRT